MGAAKLRLYGTHFCHLCHDAELILHEAGILFVYVDITDDDVLIDRYAQQVPVLQRVDTGTELGWPFDVAQVISLCKSV
ncbi:MAG: glutaredoxin family protein [Gallionellaceae bacterium]|jgi:glutaredoxin